MTPVRRNASGSRMRPVDVRLGGEVDDCVGLGDERADDVRVGDVALDEPSRAACSGSSADRREVRRGCRRR